MNTKAFFSGYVFRTLAVLTFTGLLTIQAASGQWLSGWSYRMPVTIDNSAGGSLTEYQVNVPLNSSVWAHVNPDGSDIRFTSSDGTTPLPYWIETWDYQTSADIWVKVPAIPAGSTATIYVYYGKPDATGESDGANTFEFFDDFETWNEIVPESGWEDAAPIPTPSADLTVAAYNGKLYTFGGYGLSHVVQNTVYEYDPVTDTWTAKTAMPTSRWGMVSVEFNGLIYVFGGYGVSSSTGAVEVFDPINDSWSTRSDLPSGLSAQGLMGVKFGDKIHLFYQSYHYEYDPVGDTYELKSSVPYARTWGTCAVVEDRIHIIGGHDGSGGTNTNQVLNPVNDTWTHETALPISVYGATRENPVIDGKIYVTHGWDDDYFFSTNYVYDPATDIWNQKGSAVNPRDGVGCSVIGGKLYVIGGRNVTSNTFGLTYHEVYDPLLDTWESQPGSLQWTTSGTDYVYADESADFSGDYGLVIKQPMDGSTEAFRSVETIAGFGAVYALDYDWNVTTLGGIIEARATPQAMVRLTETVTWYGNLYFYQNVNPVVRWYTGTMTHLQNSTWDNWHKVTIIRNGANSQLLFDNNLYSPLSVQTGGTGRIRFGVLRSTQYLDNVRVRKWTDVQPVLSLGTEENIEWTGTVSSDWTEAGNWNSGFVPESLMDVVVPDVTNYPIIIGNVSVNDVIIEASARMTVDPEANFTANTITINSSDTEHSGSLVNLGTITGTIVYNRHLLPKNSGGDWQLASSPVMVNSEANTEDILKAKAWDEVAGVWTNDGMLDLIQGKGYNLKQTDAGDGNVTFIGELSADDISIDATSPFQNSYDGSFDFYLRGYADGTGNSGLERDEDENWGGGGWNLLGNPFTSSMNVTAFIDHNFGIDYTTSQFDPSYLALYIHDGAAFDGVTPSYKFVAKSTGWEEFIGGSHIAAENIQVGQGFFVLAMNDFSRFTFTREMQRHDVGVPMLKSAKTDARWPGLQLKLKFDSEETSTLIVYDNNMTAGLDPGYDIGQYPNVSAIGMYTTLASGDNVVNFARQALPMADYSENKVPVGIDFETGGSVTFSAITVPIGTYKFWLEDHATGIFTDLTTKSYTVTLPAETYGTGRFFIIASTNTPTAVEDPEADGSDLRIWISNNKAVIKGSVSDRALCEVYNLNGKKILGRHLADGELNTIDLPSGLKGVFLVRVTDGVRITTRKVALL